MQCQDTSGQHPAIHISTGALELAREIETSLQAIRAIGQGEGTITAKVTGGRISFLDYTIRKFFGGKHKSSA